MVDTLGLVHAVAVHVASVHDRDGVRLVLTKRRGKAPRLWADGGYAGRLGDWALEIVKRPADTSRFQVLPHRWIVERTFG